VAGVDAEELNKQISENISFKRQKLESDSQCPIALRPDTFKPQSYQELLNDMRRN